MRPAKCRPSSMALALTVALALSVAAQDRGGNSQTPSQSSSLDSTPTSASESPSSTTQNSQTASTVQSSKSEATTSQSTPSSTSESTPSPTSESETPSTSEATALETSTSSSTAASEETTTTHSPSSTRRRTDFPSLTRGGGIPEYPPPTVPPTQNAPFMHQSSMPEGTVFIAVGVILGAFGLGIIVWRSIVSFLLHRSVNRAAMAHHSSPGKSGFPEPPAPFYKYTDQGSDMSFQGSAAAGRGVRRTNRGPIPSATPSQSNLFFSPTAATNNPSGSRNSTFMPSGFYSPGTGAPLPPPNQTNSINLTNLRPDSRGRYTNMSRHTIIGTPPDSPQYNARRDVSGVSTSSINLSSPPAGQRAPSAYLEDLLADDPNAFPPPQGPRPYSMGGYMSTPPTRY